MFQKIRNVAARLAPKVAKPAPPKPAQVGHSTQSAFRAPVAAAPVKLTGPAGTAAPSRTNLPALSGADVGRLTAQRASNPNLAALIGQRTPDAPKPTGLATSAASAPNAETLSASLKSPGSRIGADALGIDGAARELMKAGMLKSAGALVGAATRGAAMEALQSAGELLASAKADGPELPPEQQAAYDALPPEEQEAFNATRADLKEDPAAIEAQNELLAQGRVASPDEVAAYEALTDTQKQEFETVSKQIEGNPEAQDALYETLVNGTLTKGYQVGPGPDGPQGTLLSELARLSEGSDTLSDEQLAQLTGDLLIDIADPAAITQGTDYGCAPTNVRAFLAMDNPAEYARLAADLALTGEAELKMVGGNGEPITLRLPADQTFDPSRSLAEQVVGDTLLEAANGIFRRLGDNNESYPIPFLPNLTGSSTTNGATAEWTAKMMEMVTGEGHGYLGISPDSTGIGRAMQQGVLMKTIIGIHESGHEPVVKLVNGETGHMVRVTEVTDDTVTYYDPARGEERTVSRKEFMEQAELVVAPDEAMPDDQLVGIFLSEVESEIPGGQGHDSGKSQDLEPRAFLRG